MKPEESGTCWSCRRWSSFGGSYPGLGACGHPENDGGITRHDETCVHYHKREEPT